MIATGMLVLTLGVDRRISGQPEYLQLGQLSVSGPALDTLGDRLRPGCGAARVSGIARWAGVSLLRCGDGGAVHLRCRGVVSSIGLGRWAACADPPPGRRPRAGWLGDHPEIRSIFGGYWDVYRLAFLRAGKVKGIPFPLFPNRFPEWSNGLPGGRPETLLARAVTGGAVVLEPGTARRVERCSTGKAV